MTVQYGLPALPLIQYDGTNSTDVLAAMNIGSPIDLVTTITSESGGTLVLHWEVSGGDPNGFEGNLTVETDEWVVPLTGPGLASPRAVSDAEVSTQWLIRE